VRVEAFVCRQPDENHEGVYRFLLSAIAGCYAWPTPGQESAHLPDRGIARDAVSGRRTRPHSRQVLDAVDTDFNKLLETRLQVLHPEGVGLAVARGESLKNLEAFDI